VDKDVEKMIAEQFIAMEVIVKGKRYIGYGAPVQGAAKSCFPERIPAEACHADMRICLNMVPVIKDVGALKRVGIKKKNNDS